MQFYRGLKPTNNDAGADHCLRAVQFYRGLKQSLYEYMARMSLRAVQFYRGLKLLDEETRQELV